MSLGWRTNRRHATPVGCAALAILSMLVVLGMAWPQLAGAIEAEYGNIDGISIPVTGNGNPYPSTITVAGMTGNITNVVVSLLDLSHTSPPDIEILLLGPTGANVVLMAVCCDGTAAVDVDLDFEDSAPTQLPNTGAGPLVSGSFQPSDFGACGGAGDFDPPAGACPYGSTLSVFNGTDPNGTWNLLVRDPSPDDSGNIEGWVLTITTDSPTGAQVVSFAAVRYEGGWVQVNWRTSAEVDTLGFRLYRDSGGMRTLITPGLVAGSALQMGTTRLSTDLSYAWTDRLAAEDGAVQYWLEEVDLRGQLSQHGPAVPQVVSSPSPNVSRATLLSEIGRQTSLDPRPSGGTPVVLQQPRLGGDLATQLALAAQPAAKLAVRDSGWYRVCYEDLAAIGLDRALDPGGIRLYLRGQEQAIQVHHAVPGRFGAGDCVEFYGQGQDTPHTDRHIYWLVAGRPGGARIPALESAAAPGGVESFPTTVEQRHRVVYFAGLQNGEAENFFGPAILPAPLEQQMSLAGVATDAPGEAALEVAVQGVGGLAEINPDHVVQVWVNGVAVGQVVYDGQTSQVGRFVFAQSVLHEGANTIRLQAQGGPLDVSLLDYLKLSYWRTYTAAEDRLLFTVDSPATQTSQSVDGFTTPEIRVFDITNPARVSELVGSVQPGNSYRVSVAMLGPGPRTLLAVSEAQIKTPVDISANAPSRWHARRQGADLVIIAPSAFAEAARTLSEARQAEGLRVAVVDVEDLADEANYGEPGPQTIRAFLRLAWETWDPKPRFVLLMGDGTYDPRNYLGHGEIDYVPTKLVDTEFMETSSDDWFVDFNNDGLPELPIGRLPVRTAEAANRVVAKLVDYSRARVSVKDAASQRALLVADIPDVYDFEQVNARVRQQLPASMTVTEVRRRDTGDAAAQQLIQEQINAGVSLVAYSGHGSYTFWRGDLMTVASAHALSNGERLPVVAAMTCLNGYFPDPVQESLAEALLQAEGGGAIAVLALSGMSYAAGQAQVLEIWTQIMFADGHGAAGPTLGEAMVQAKAATTDRDVRRTWNLLGDPSMQLAK